MGDTYTMTYTHILIVVAYVIAQSVGVILHCVMLSIFASFNLQC